MTPKPSTVAEYLATLPEDRRHAIEEVRKVIKKNLDKKFEEGIQYGMVGYYVPHSVFPEGYHCDPTQPLPFASIASQKNHIGLYLFCVYMDQDLYQWFCEAWKAAGKKLDMGKSCVRVKKLEDIPLDVVGQLFKRVKAKDFVAHYVASRAAGNKRPPKKKATAKKAAKKPATKKSTAKKAAKKPAAKKATAKKATAKKATAKKAAKKATRKPAVRKKAARK